MSSNFFGLQTRQFVAHPQTVAEEAAFRDKVDPELWASKAMGDMVCDWYLRAPEATQDKFDRVLGNLGFIDDLHKGVPDLSLALERAETSSAMSGISGRPLGSRVRDQIVPPTLNLDDPDEGTEGVDLVPHTAKKREVNAVLNNSFGFGGTNASLIMRKVD